MDFPLPSDYGALLGTYTKLKKEFEEVKQSLHDTTRQLKVNEALLTEYQGEIDILQNGETLRGLKYESRISSLEKTLASLRSDHIQDMSMLQSEVFKKDKEIEGLKIEMEALRKMHSTEDQCELSLKFNEMVDLSNENELLKQNYDELRESCEHFRIKHNEVEESLQEYKKLANELRENLKGKNEQLEENSVLIEKLNTDIFSITRDLEIYKHKPLQADSKGNSLFAEVDDRRQLLEKTISDLKSSYVHLKQEHSRHEKVISFLRKENNDIRASWKKDLEQIQEDNNEVVDSLNSRLKVLEYINDKQKQRLEEQVKPPSDDLCAEYQFYLDMIESKSSEIKKLEKKLSDQSVTQHLMSVSLAQAHKELRLLRLSMLDLQKQTKENLP